MKLPFILTLSKLFFYSVVAMAQPPFGKISKEEVDSKILGEKRQLFVYSPDHANQKFPLIIVFDGEGLFEPVVSNLRFMNNYSEIPIAPEAIVVGIVNTDRPRDMPIPQEYGTKLGEEQFKKFISEELIPTFNTNYPLNGQVILIGHSQGGLFVSYLMASSPQTFSWAVAIDAPLNISDNVSWIKDSISKLANKPESKIRYVSAEAIFGWREFFMKNCLEPNQIAQFKYPDETHESVAGKSVYDGLKFLFKDFAPTRKDKQLIELQLQFEDMQRKYGYPYEIPLPVLLASAKRKIPENRKDEVLKLLDYADEKYGITERSKALRTSAMKITKEPDTVVDQYLRSKVSQEQIKKYLGHWEGLLLGPKGEEFPMSVDIQFKEGRAVVIENSKMSGDAVSEAQLVAIDDKNVLLFGRKNRGSGWLIWKVTQNGNTLNGVINLMGFTIPSDAPEDFKKTMEWHLSHPERFKLTRR